MHQLITSKISFFTKATCNKNYSSTMPTFYPAAVYDTDKKPSEITVPLLGEEEYQVKASTIRSDGEILKRFEFLKARFLCVGAFIGFSVQVISLMAYIHSLVHFGKGKKAFRSSTSEQIIYIVLEFLIRIDLCVYCVVWVAFTLSMTRPGVNFVMTRLDSGLGCTKATRRFVFLLGVNWLVGLVLGAFASWSILDVYFYFPVPYAPIVATAIINLALCYFMTICYDCRKANVEKEEEDNDEEC
jgi:hypothetical protein